MDDLKKKMEVETPEQLAMGKYEECSCSYNFFELYSLKLPVCFKKQTDKFSPPQQILMIGFELANLL